MAPFSRASAPCRAIANAAGPAARSHARHTGLGLSNQNPASSPRCQPASQPNQPALPPVSVALLSLKKGRGHRGPSFLSSSCSGTRPPYARHAPDVPSPPPPQTRTVRTVVDIASQCFSLLVSLAHSFHRSIAHSRSFTLSQTPLRSITFSLSHPHTLSHSLDSLALSRTLSHSRTLSRTHSLALVPIVRP